MFAFLIIAGVVYWGFSKFYVIAEKSGTVSDWQSFLLFATFMFICTLLWLAFKFIFKPPMVGTWKHSPIWSATQNFLNIFRRN